MASIYDLSWKRISWIDKLNLIRKSQQDHAKKFNSGDDIIKAEGCSALSSTYYSVLGTAFAHLKLAFKFSWKFPAKFLFWIFAWLPLAMWCRWRMTYWSNQVVKLIGYEGMTADQCDVRQSILRRCGRWSEAEDCIQIGLKASNLQAHTESLLRIGLAHVYFQGKNYDAAKKETERAFTCGHEVVGDLNQSSRIYRHCANLFKRFKDPSANYSAEVAEALAKETGARDQYQKMGWQKGNFRRKKQRFY